jgi:uncharacterized membrane protein
VEIDELLGLPAHPLLVHGVVALVPAAAALTVVAAFWPAARRRIGWVGVLLAVGALANVWLAQGSGEQLEDRIEETELVEDHTAIGDQLLLPAVALVAGSVLVTAVGRQRTRPAGAAVSALVAVVALATSGVALVQTFRAGHSGAKAVWDDTGEDGDDGGDGRGRGRGRGRGGDDDADGTAESLGAGTGPVRRP